MIPSRKPFAVFSGNRTLNAAFLVLILATAVYLLLHVKGIGGSPQGNKPFLRNVIALFLVISTLLIPGVLLQFARALQEREPRKQEPAECAMDPSPREFRFFWKGASQDLIPGCISFLEKHFSRYYFFHSFNAPHLSFTYLAKTGIVSLFALPWIKTGIVLFLLLCSCYLALPGFLPPVEGRLLVLAFSIFFWIPGLWALWFHPYQKIWIRLLERGGSVQITVICVSPFRVSKRNALCSALEPALCRSSAEKPLPEQTGTRRHA